MPLEKRKKRVISSWTKTKGLLAILLFLIGAFLIEYAIIVVFSLHGLSDIAILAASFKIPGTDLSFSVSISLLFHLIPISVIITLLASWLHLMKYVGIVSYETTAIQRKQVKEKKGSQRTRSSIKRSFQRLRIVLRLDYISSFWKRSHFLRATVKSSFAVLSLFLFLVFVLHLATHPTFLYEFVSHLYQNSQIFHDFILGTSQTISAINNSLSTTAVGFARDMSNLIRPLGKMITNLDILSKYLLCQNLPAWTSAFLVLLYGYHKHISEKL